jgi:hypothetical protein
MDTKEWAMPRITSRRAAPLLGIAMAVSLIAPASADLVASGVAVDSVGSLGSSVGDTSGGYIAYFIPLSGHIATNVIYGTDTVLTNGGGLPSACSGEFGTCSDYGNGGSKLTMILRFDFAPVGANNSPGNPYSSGTLQVRFKDLDVSPFNDPSGFVESLDVLDSSGISRLPGGPITNAGSLITGNSDEQLLTLALNFSLGDPTYLQLVFASDWGTQYGTNTVEKLKATITVNPVPGPLVGAGLPGLVVACGGLFAWARRRRQKLV